MDSWIDNAPLCRNRQETKSRPGLCVAQNDDPRLEACATLPKIMNKSILPTFTSCDWGTSNLRIRRVEKGGVRATFRSERGASTFSSREEFPDVLRAGMEEIGARPPVVISGMASSSLGWRELPYATVPFRLDGSAAVVEEVAPEIFLVSGVRAAEEILRGEETQLLGFGQLPEEAVVILPGTHSKHCRVREGVLTGFSTFLTGELHAVLSRHSVLRHAIADGEDEAAFGEGVVRGRESPLLEALFRVRTRQVLDHLDPVSNGAYLSGLLIGSELANVPSTGSLVLAAAGRLGALYRRAFAVLDLTDRSLILSDDACEALVVKGQQKILSHRIRPPAHG